MAASSGPKCCFTLIVGDGNFSFSLTYSRLNPEDNIVATSLDSERTVSDRYDGAENVAQLKLTHSVTLLHGIDATKLKEYPELSGKVFKLIIFNFPHTGGKSNIKKNRALILAFFHSASQFLDSEGEVHVTLCKGQGGTPVDEPREYGNTWKVVEMAADAGLMLTRIVPFPSADLPGYLATGYRSQGKPFSADNALTHVFTCYRTTPLNMCSGVPPLSLAMLCGSELRPVVADCLPLLPAELHPYLSSPMHTADSHPLYVVLKQVSTSLNVLGLADCASLMEPSCSSDVTTGVVCVSPAEADGASNETNFFINLAHLSSSVEAPEKLATLLSNGEPLLPFLLKTAVHCASETTGLFCVCRTFRNSLPQLGLTGQVASHELVGVITPRGDKCENPKLLFSTLEEVVWKILGSLQSMSSLGHCVSDKMADTPLVTDCKGIIWMPAKGQDTAHSSHLNFSSGFEYTEDTFPLLQYGYYRQRSDLSREDTLQVAFTFHLDALALLSFAIPDHRLLWSSEQRFTHQFQQGCIDGPKTFVPFSIFPSKYTHDVSFWVNRPGHESKWTSEAVFRSIVRQICGRLVATVYLHDSHTAKDGSTGLCYRVVYSSCDEVLSRSKAYSLQQQLRLAIRDRLGVELR